MTIRRQKRYWHRWGSTKQRVEKKKRTSTKQNTASIIIPIISNQEAEGRQTHQPRAQSHASETSRVLITTTPGEMQREKRADVARDSINYLD